MRKSCKYCGKTHELTESCPNKPAQQARVKPPTNNSKFRSTWAWTKKSREVMRRDNYLCLECLSRGDITYDGLGVHHITPLEENYDLRLESDELITLCSEHHKKAERGAIGRERLRGLVKQSQAGNHPLPPYRPAR